MKEGTILYVALTLTPDPDVEKNSVLLGGWVNSTESKVAIQFDRETKSRGQSSSHLMLKAKKLISNSYSPPGYINFPKTYKV